METRHRHSAAGLDLAGDLAFIERAMGLQRNDCRIGIVLVFVLVGSLHGAQRIGIHRAISLL